MTPGTARRLASGLMLAGALLAGAEAICAPVDRPDPPGTATDVVLVTLGL